MPPPSSEADGLFIGLMSGTSADGIDGCLVALGDDTPTQVIAHRYYPFDPTLRERILAAMRSTSLVDAAELDARLADEAAAVTHSLVEGRNIDANPIRAIGCHGPTLLHQPKADYPTSVQITDPNRLAVLSGVDIVTDFRRADIAAGGEGAPLTPAFHAAMFTAQDEARAVLNLGGIANLTLLPAAGNAPIRGFDTGPANVLLDLWCTRTTGATYDHDGAQAARGQIDERLLAHLLDDPYFSRSPPKSTGREHFNAAWLDARRAKVPATVAAADVQATLAELTARTVADALAAEMPQAQRLLVCGGGAYNRHLMGRLAHLLPGAVVESTAPYGLPPQQVEAAAFAWLARQRLLCRAGNLPAVTGARQSLVLGAHTRAPQ